MIDITKPQTLTAIPVKAADGGASTDAAEEASLIARAQEGEAEAFDLLMRRYERRVIALGLQMGLSKDDSLDACQETFIKVFKYIRRFRTGGSFFHWLYRIAIHSIYDHRRRSRLPGGVVALDDGAAPNDLLRDGAPSPERRAESADLVRKLLSGLDSLSRRERTVFVLRDLQGLSTEEIATVLRLTRVTIRRHCMIARQKLRARVFRRKL